MSVAAVAAGVTSSEGLTALVMRGIRSGNGTGDFRHKSEKKRRRDNGYIRYEQERKSEGDVSSAMACGTQSVIDQGEGIHAAT
jgi:hypothetical protein